MKRSRQTFQKRQKELKRVDKKKAKAERLAAARSRNADERQADPEGYDILELTPEGMIPPPEPRSEPPVPRLDENRRADEE